MWEQKSAYSRDLLIDVSLEWLKLAYLFSIFLNICRRRKKENEEMRTVANEARKNSPETGGGDPEVEIAAQIDPLHHNA